MVRGGDDDEAESRARRADEAPPSPCRAAYSARTRDLRSVPELLGESLRPSHKSPRAIASVEVGIALGLLTTDAMKAVMHPRLHQTHYEHLPNATSLVPGT